MRKLKQYRIFTLILVLLAITTSHLYGETRVNLTKSMMYEWSGWGADAHKTSDEPYSDCRYDMGFSTDLAYGDIGVNAYADLSAFSHLLVTVTDGVPRMLFNRDETDGQWNEDESQSHLIDNTRDGWSNRYFYVDGNTYIVDLALMKAEKGFAHLHAIKGADWANVTVTAMVLTISGNQVDMTSSIANPDFEEGLSDGQAEGWTVDRNGDNVSLTPGPFGEEDEMKLRDAIGRVNHCFEAWHCHDFDVWQEVKGLPAGVYSISVQGFVRNESDSSENPFRLYMNDYTTTFPDVNSEQISADKYDADGNLPVIEGHSWNGESWNKVQNSMGASSMCFAWGMYNVTLVGEVKEGECLRIGVRGKTDSEWWCIWDNFQLTYLSNGQDDISSDVTDKIANPNFDNASSEGWLGSEPGMCGDGNHCLANVAEVWNNTFDIYQDLNGLSDGYYELCAKTSWRGSWNDMENGVGPASKLYAIVNGKEWSVPFNYIWSCMNTEPLGGQTYFGTNAGELAEEHNGKTYYSPTDPSAFRLYAEKGFYDTTLKFEVVGGQARIGVKNPNMMGDSDNWSCFDSFTLTYLGSVQDDDHWKEKLTNRPVYLRNEATGLFWGTANEWGTQASLLKHPEYVTLHEQPDGKYTMETQYIYGDEGNIYFNGNTMDQQPISLTIQPVDDGLFTIAHDDNLYYGYDGSSSVLAKELGADDINARWRVFTESEMQATLNSASVDNPVDATFFIADPNFSRNHRRLGVWSMEADNQNLCGGKDENKCAESWQSAFTLSQTVNVPNGLYVLNAQAALTDYTGAYDGTDYPVVYANESTSAFCNMEEEDRATSMDKLSEAFTAGKYVVKPVIVFVTDGKLTVGVKGTRTDTWAIWDNFELYYYGDSDPVSEYSFKEFAENTVLLTKTYEIESQKSQLNWIEGGTAQAMKSGTINPSNGQEGANIVEEGILLKNNNPDKALKTYVTGIECVWAYGCTAGNANRDLVVNVYNRFNQLVTSNRATSSDYHSVVVEVNGLDPSEKYIIEYLGCNEGETTGADVVLHGVKFLKKYYTEKTFVYRKIKYHTTSDKTVEVIGNDGSLSGSVSIPSRVTNGGVTYDVTSIGVQALAWIGSITSVTIPSTVLSIEDQAIMCCGELKSINVNTNNPNYCSVDGVLFTKDMKRLVSYPAGKDALYYAIPEGVEILGTSCMVECSKLESITIPSSFKDGWWRPFKCENLTKVICMMEKPFNEEYDEYLFDPQIYSKATLWVPQGCISNYQSRSPWNKFTVIRELPSKITVTVKDKSMVYGDVPPTDFEMAVTNGPLFGTPVYTCDVKKTTNAGTYDISIVQGTLSSPVSIEYVNGKMTVAKAPLTAYVDNYQRNMGESNPAFVVKYKGFRNSDNESVITTKPVASCTADAKSPAGKYPIEISGGLAANYTFNYESGELTVLENYTMSITVLGNGSVTYSGKKVTSYEQFTLPVGTNVTLTLTAGTNCLLSQATMNGDDIMSSISNNNYTLNNIHQNVNIVIGFVERGTINIVAQSYTITYGDELPATYEYNVVGGTVTGQPSITCSAKKDSPVGKYSIIVTKGTLNSTDKLTYTRGTLTIVPATLTASVGNYQRYKGQENPKFEVTCEGFRNGETASVLKQQPVPACAATTSSPAGRYPITLSGGLADNYTFDYVNGELTVIDNNVLNIASQGHGCVKYGNNIIRSNNSYEVTPGSSVVLAFTPDDGYYLSNLTLNGQDVLGNVSNNSYTISNVSQDMSVIAQFSERLGDFVVDGISYTIISSPNKTLSVAQGNYQGHVKIPAKVDHDGQTWSVVGLADNAFNNSTSLLTIELPSSLKVSEVGISLFTGCTSLAAIIWNANSAMTPAQLGVVNNQNLLFYANSKSFVPEGIINAVVNGNADQLVLTDGGGNFYCPTQFTAKSATYTHNYTMESAINGVQGWETLALPFDVQKIEHSREGALVPFIKYHRDNANERPFWLYTYGNSGFERSDVIAANRAYIICMPNNAEYDSEYRLNGQVTFSSQNVTVESSAWNCNQRKGDKEFCPAFCLQKQSAEVYALNVSNDLHNETDNRLPGSAFISNLRAVSPFEAYMTTATNRSRSVIDIEFDDATGIGFLSDSDIPSSRQRIYSLTGQLVFQGDSREEFQKVLKKLPVGVYIINGRKQQIK